VIFLYNIFFIYLRMKKNFLIILSVVFATIVAGFTTTVSAKVVKVGVSTLNWNPENNVAEGVANFSTDAPFVIEIDGVDYGYTPFSGNGGVGTVPATGSPISWAGSYVDKSIGQLKLSNDGGLPLWIYTGQGGDVFVRIDFSNADAVPRYYVALPENDPRIIINERFDLFQWGGDWIMGRTTKENNPYRYPAASIIPADYDGTEPATVTIVSGATSATVNTGIHSSNAPLFVKNRGLEGWELTNIYEHVGYLRLSNGTAATGTTYGILKTPAFGSKLSGASNVKVEFDICRFPTVGSFYFQVEGPGSITSASYIDLIENGVTYGGTNADNAITTLTPIGGATGTSLVISSDRSVGGILPAWESANNDDRKFWTHLVINIEGATSETKVVWDAKGPDVTTVASARFCLNNLLITNLSYVTGIESVTQSKSGVKVYPSVVKEGQLLNLGLPEGIGKVNIYVFDATGRLVQQLKNVSRGIPAPSQKGIFFLQIQTPEKLFATQRIIVK
jgi:hypothetical protein